MLRSRTPSLRERIHQPSKVLPPQVAAPQRCDERQKEGQNDDKEEHDLSSGGILRRRHQHRRSSNLLRRAVLLAGTVVSHRVVLPKGHGLSLKKLSHCHISSNSNM